MIRSFLLFLALSVNPAYTLAANFSLIKNNFERFNCWGLHTSVDLYNCDSNLIKKKSYIEKFVVTLCELIKMKHFGDPVIIHFGEDERVAGYSMYQLIETSNISGHFANDSSAAYIDIFSCKLYDPNIIATYACAFFGAKSFKINITYRY